MNPFQNLAHFKLRDYRRFSQTRLFKLWYSKSGVFKINQSLLQSWMDEEDSEEQQETGEYLIHALDEDRLSERKLFPVELKGVTW